MAESPHVVNVTTGTFASVVVEGSHQRPVLVDFWADWCAPCRMLTPILERVADGYQGRLLVAKVNTEEERELAAQFGIRSLPTVRLFQNGRAVGEFMGALPERDVRAFLDQHLPRESDGLLDQALGLLAGGDLDGAARRVERAQAMDPDHPRVLLTLAQLRAAQGDLTGAEQALKALPFDQQDDPEALALRGRLAFQRVLAGAPTAAELERRLQADPRDSEACYQLAAHRVTGQDYEGALELLVGLLRRDRKYGDDAARKAMLQIFDLLGGGGDLVTRYRARMMNALF